MEDKDYKRFYKYLSMANDTPVNFRVPKELKEDFTKLTNSDGFAKVLRELMAKYILENEKK